MLTSDWDFYLCKVDDKPASIFLDLNAFEIATASEFPSIAYIRVKMNQPRADGLSSQEEYEALEMLEKSVERSFVDSETKYVGRCTTNSQRDFFFYVTDDFGWEERVTKCMGTHQNYQYETGVRSDPDWSTYHSYLYPSEPTRQSIENRRACDALENHGDKLELAREIDHWAYFPDEVTRNNFVIEALKIGFSVRELTLIAEGVNRYCARVWRNDIPDYRSIDDITLPLFHLATSYMGKYDGWESPAIQ